MAYSNQQMRSPSAAQNGVFPLGIRSHPTASAQQMGGFFAAQNGASSSSVHSHPTASTQQMGGFFAAQNGASSSSARSHPIASTEQMGGFPAAQNGASSSEIPGNTSLPPSSLAMEPFFLQDDTLMVFLDELNLHIHTTTASLTLIPQPEQNDYTVVLRGLPRSLPSNHPLVESNFQLALANCGQLSFQHFSPVEHFAQIAALTDVAQNLTGVTVWGNRKISATLESLEFNPRIIVGIWTAWVNGDCELRVTGVQLKVRVVGDTVFGFGDLLGYHMDRYHVRDQMGMLVLSPFEESFMRRMALDSGVQQQVAGGVDPPAGIPLQQAPQAQCTAEGYVDPRLLSVQGSMEAGQGGPVGNPFTPLEVEFGVDLNAPFDLGVPSQQAPAPFQPPQRLAAEQPAAQPASDELVVEEGEEGVLGEEPLAEGEDLFGESEATPPPAPRPFRLALPQMAPPPRPLPAPPASPPHPAKGKKRMASAAGLSANLPSDFRHPPLSGPSPRLNPPPRSAKVL